MQYLPDNSSGSRAPNRVDPREPHPNQTSNDTQYGDINEKPRKVWDIGDWSVGYFILIILAACLILFLASVIIPDASDAVVDTIRYFKRLFRRARFYPHFNKELWTLGFWTAFVCFVIWCVKGWMNRGNKDD